VKSSRSSILKKAVKIRLLLLDVDGVMTDGRIIIDDRGVETKHFNVRDGQGITLLQASGIEVGIITGRTSQVVRHRARDLGVKLVLQGVKDKLKAYQRIRRSLGLTDDQVAYMGDDYADSTLLAQVGLAAMPGDGWPELRCRVDVVTRSKGGDGAVREIAELLLKAQGMWSKLASNHRKL
jgi:3-deoxy-D-manno-octulosonate 8-phosphate phosphatase (KDO 8-P phosphatase)